MDDVVIEPERPDDSPAIEAVVRQAFADHPAVADMVTAIRRSSRYRSGLALTARRANQVVGFVMLSGTDLVDDHGACREVLTLTPLAVAPEHSETASAARLFARHSPPPMPSANRWSSSRGAPSTTAGVGSGTPDYGITIDLPSWAPREAAQVYLLANYRPAVRGHVQYPAAIIAASG